MCNDDAKEVPNLEWVVVRKEQMVKWRWWIESKSEDNGEMQNMKSSDDPLKSNMKGSHINNERNDGKANDPELLRESHSSHSQNIRQNEYIKWRVSGSSHTNSSKNILNKMTLEHQYTCSMMENTTRMRLLFFIFFYIYTNVHALNVNKETPKMTSKMDKQTLKC